MSRLLLPIAGGALLALAALVVVTALTRPAAPASRDEQVRQVAAELRCPDCEGLSVADSTSASAAEIRREIAAMLAAGHTPEQARQAFVSRYGNWILLAPGAPLAWILPFTAVVAGLALVGAWAWRRRAMARAADPATGSPADHAASVSDADRARAREEAEALDA